MTSVGMHQEMADLDDFSVPEFDSAMFTLPSVEISTSAPHRIHFASNEWLDLFQFSREEIAGRSLRIVFGPCTIMKELQRVIQTAQDGKEAQATIICYSSSGLGKTVVVKSAPIGSDGALCRLTMILSDAILFKDAPLGEDLPRAIISVGQRPVVEFVNSRFSYDFGIPGVMASKALRMIQGPRTDSAQFMQAIGQTKTGFVQRVRTYVYSSECKETLFDVSFQPLLGSDGAISHLVAVFLPLGEEQYGECFQSFEMAAPNLPAQPSLCAQAHQSYNTDHAHVSEPQWCTAEAYQLPVIPEVAPSATTFDFGALEAALAPAEQIVSTESSFHAATPSPVSEEQPQCAAAARTSLKLIPRKKQNFSGKSSGAFELTTEKLREMGRISMKQAAHELGIAPSTLKKACRKLGVERWPHGSHGGNKSKGSLDYDGSYVRRLFAKYSRGKACPETPDSASSPSHSDRDFEVERCTAQDALPAQHQVPMDGAAWQAMEDFTPYEQLERSAPFAFETVDHQFSALHSVPVGAVF